MSSIWIYYYLVTDESRVGDSSASSCKRFMSSSMKEPLWQLARGSKNLHVCCLCLKCNKNLNSRLAQGKPLIWQPVDFQGRCTGLTSDWDSARSLKNPKIFYCHLQQTPAVGARSGCTCSLGVCRFLPQPKGMLFN